MERAGAQVAQPSNKLMGWMGNTRGFLVGVREELRKVTWPTREELTKATRMIIVLSIVLGFTIGLLDFVLQAILVNGVAQLAR
jgi:preprotein translocase SecE subunit